MIKSDQPQSYQVSNQWATASPASVKTGKMQRTCAGGMTYKVHPLRQPLCKMLELEARRSGAQWEMHFILDRELKVMGLFKNRFCRFFPHLTCHVPNALHLFSLNSMHSDRNEFEVTVAAGSPRS